MTPVFQMKKMLENLESWMTKAAAHADKKKFEVDNYCTLRLAPDMFTFVEQIQSACDAAKFTAAYLSGQTPPKHPDEETTWKECKERVTKVLKYLNGFKEKDFSGWEGKKVSPGWAEGKWLHAEEYLNDLAIPNFYFHVNMAYAILRHAGVDIGKEDYLGEIKLKK
jgi:hypothetical protein